jgi:hypothetical protein
MNKREKETAAIYLSACLDEMRKARIYNDDAAYNRADADWKSYHERIKQILIMKFEMFALDDYEKTVIKPIHEIMKITQVFYSQRVNGEQLKYPA